MRRTTWIAALALAFVACAAEGENDSAAAGPLGPINTEDGGPIGAGGGGAGIDAPWEGDPHAGENYRDWGENPFVDPKEDNLCTFGVDVDTASYALMRRDVNQGRLPAPRGVRTEEYLNYFRYGYEPPSPEDEHAFAVRLDGAPSLFGEVDDEGASTLHLLRIGIKGKEIPAPERGRANLVFLVDVSGSMASGDKLGLVKESLRMLVDELRPDDTIGIVTYAGESRVALPPTPVAEREAILAVIDGLQPGGSTNGEAGIRTAYDLAEDHKAEGGINRVILCTDGDLNVGLTGDALIALIEDFRERGIFLTTLGFGSGNYNDALMEQLADKGNGNYAYIDSLREAERVLKRDVLGTLVVIARDVKVQVELDPESVVRYRLLGYENRDVPDDRFEDPDVDTGDIGSGHAVTALIELELDPAVREPGAVAAHVATVRVRYQPPAGGEEREISASIATSDLATSPWTAQEDLRFAMAVAEYAEILRRHSQSVGARFDELIELASGATAGGDPDRLEFLDLATKAREIWNR